MRNKLTRNGRRLTKEEQVLRKKMILDDILHLETVFDYVEVENVVDIQ